MEGDLLFSTEEELQEVRERVLELTGIDIAQGKMSAGSRNITYVISESTKPSVVRISPTYVKSIQTVHSELLFVDYLREHMRTVCNPVPYHESLVNVITVAGRDYYVVVSRKANGISPSNSDFADAHIFTLYGEALGRLHVGSRTAYEEQFRFMRPDWLDAPGFNFSLEDAGDTIPADVLEIMISIRDKVAEMPRTLESFGLIHGDASPINSFLDWDDVWFFDFDDCCYHYYLYDCACFLIQAASAAAENGATFDPVEEFMKGYARSNPQTAPLMTQDTLEKLYNLRIASGMWLLTQSRTEQGIESAKTYIPYICTELRKMGAKA